MFYVNVLQKKKVKKRTLAFFIQKQAKSPFLGYLLVGNLTNNKIFNLK